MAAILAEQSIVAENIKRIHSEYVQSKERDDETLKEFLTRMESQWKIFELNNSKLNEDVTVDMGHSYFTRDIYGETKKLYENLKERIASRFKDNATRRPGNGVDDPGTSFNDSCRLRKIQIDVDEQEEENVKKKKIVWNMRMKIFREKLTTATLENDASAGYLKQKIRSLESQWREISQLGYEILALDSSQDMAKTIMEAETECDNGLFIIQDKIRANEEIRIQPATITYFDGTYENWRSFHDQFLDAVHKNQTMGKAQKMTQLKQYTKGDAYRLIKNMNAASDYDTAWEMLKSRYDNDRKLVRNYYETIRDLPTLQQESAKGLRNLHDVIYEALQAMGNMGFTTTEDHYVGNVILDKMDEESMREFERTLREPRKVPTIPSILKFLEERADSIETCGAKHKTYYKKYDKPSKNASLSETTSGNTEKKCYICNNNHSILQCEKFKKMDLSKRWEEVKKLKICTICFGKHFFKDCKSSFKCGKCQGRHSTFLHNEKRNEKKSLMAANTDVRDVSEVFVATALIRCKTAKGDYIILRAMKDGGSQATFITEDAAQKLQLKRERIHAEIDAFGDTSAGESKSRVELEVASGPDTDCNVILEALVVKKISRDLPNEIINTDAWEHLKNIPLADPHYNIPGHIDISIGSDAFGEFILPGVIKGPPGTPYALLTTLGWIVMGNTTKKGKRVVSYTTNVKIEEQLQRFWETEAIQVDERATEDEMCLEFLRKNKTRGSDGRYRVALPFNNSIKKLGRSKKMAVAQMLQLEKKFKTNPKFKEQYVKCINEYLELGHMKRVYTTEDEMATYDGEKMQFNTAYLPHHAVFKESSTTTKCRCVFDASRKTTSGICVNDAMLKGPKNQRDIYSIILNWRKYPIVFTADIEKMYRQIWVEDKDAEFQRIVWRESEDEPLRDYKLTTVTFGTTSAPFVATQVVQDRAIEHMEVYPEAAEAVIDCTYMDDTCAGAWKIETAIRTQHDLKKMLGSAGFELRKFTSNNIRFLEAAAPEDREIQLDEFYTKEFVKVLGLYWNNSADHFIYKFNIDKKYIGAPITKREFLSITASLFDPMGWLAALSVKIKIMYQKMWINGIDWDEQIDEELQREWNVLSKEIELINQIKIIRWIHMSEEEQEIQLHGFCDASIWAYGACIYVRTITRDGIVKVMLLTAKTRIAPRNKEGKSEITLPKLELCGAHLLAQLFKKVTSAMKLKNVKCYAWCDSMITLSWIKGQPSRWKTYVGNRTSEIRDIIAPEIWRYVPTDTNPADLASRGLRPTALHENDSWWYGPQWLQEGEENWPEQPTQFDTLEEMRTSKLTHMTMIKEDDFLDISEWNKLQRASALCLRFAQNCRSKTRNSQPVTIGEIRKATIRILTQVQDKHFAYEKGAILKGNSIKESSKLAPLHPFLDNDGLLRVGGRLKNALIGYNQKHPIILPHSTHISKLIVDNAHITTAHGGTNATLAFIRSKYWIIGAKGLVKTRVGRCMRCAKLNAQVMKQAMGDLPEYRVTPNRPFFHSGVDYAGPFDIRTAKGRGHKTHKGYIALFICMATKAIHLEVVSDLTSTGFIAALKRFGSRRGYPKKIHSDNGSNFGGANKFLKAQTKQEREQMNKEIAKFYTNNAIEWDFNPPAAPHFGGLWEAGVKSVKTHLKKLQATSFTFEEFTTILAQIEACLNSRPLCPISDDIEDLGILTPAHFLTGDSMIAPADNSDFEYDKPCLLTRWQLVQHKHREFWNQWSRDYLHRLQARPKWLRSRENIKIGDLVLISDTNLGPTQWPMARVIKTHPGKDGLVRVATLKTKNGTLQRPIVKLRLLPNPEKPREVQMNSTDANKVTQQAVPTETPKGDHQTASAAKEQTKKDKNQRNFCKKSTKKTAPTRKKREISPEMKTRSNERTTRTRYNLRALLALVFLALFGITGAHPVEQTFEINKFNGQTGIYFEQISQARLINSEWHMIIYYDMNGFWKQMDLFKKQRKRMKNICDDISGMQLHDETATCMQTLKQFDQHFDEIREKNNLFHAINTPVEERRVKRGLIDGIGIVAGELFGVLDKRFAEKYNDDIDMIQENEGYTLELIKNQTSIIEVTQNLMRKSEQEVMTEFEHLSTFCRNISELIQYNNEEVSNLKRRQAFAEMALQTTIALQRFEKMQDTLIDVITDTQHGHTNPSLLPPDQLRTQITQIRANIPNELSLIGELHGENLFEVYASMKISTRIVKNRLIFDITVPLVHINEYTIFKLHPIPIYTNGTAYIITTDIEYLLIDQRKELYNGIKRADVEKCTKHGSMLYCKQHFSLLKEKAIEHRCEVQILKHHKKLDQTCKLEKTTNTNRWIQLQSDNQWIFSIEKTSTVDILCGSRAQHIDLDGQGIIKMLEYCSIQLPDRQLRTLGYSETKNTQSFIPSLNVDYLEQAVTVKSFSQNITTHISTHTHELRTLREQLDELRMNTELHRQQKLNHHIHHYSTIYIVYTIMGTAAIFLCYKKFIKVNKKTITNTAAMNAPVLPQNQTINLAHSLPNLSGMTI